MTGIKPMQKMSIVILPLLFSFNLWAADPPSEVVSFKCGLAIDAVFAALDTQADNPVTQEAMAKIDESNGEFICIPGDDSKIYVMVQSREMSDIENRLVFTVDTSTYRVVKTLFGR